MSSSSLFLLGLGDELGHALDTPLPQLLVTVEQTSGRGERRGVGGHDLSLAHLTLGDEPGPFQDLALRSIALWPEWLREVEEDSGQAVEYRSAGKLILALDEGEAEHLRGRLRLGAGSILFLLIAAPWRLLAGLNNDRFFWFYFVNEHFSGRCAPFVARQ